MINNQQVVATERELNSLQRPESGRRAESVTRPTCAASSQCAHGAAWRNFPNPAVSHVADVHKACAIDGDILRPRKACQCPQPICKCRRPTARNSGNSARRAQAATDAVIRIIGNHNLVAPNCDSLGPVKTRLCPEAVLKRGRASTRQRGNGACGYHHKSNAVVRIVCNIHKICRHCELRRAIKAC